MGKRAFSAKAKREQLRTKRATSSLLGAPRPGAPSLGGGNSGGGGGGEAAGTGVSSAAGIASASAAGSPARAAGSSRAREPRQNNKKSRPNSTRFRLAFAADSDAARAAARAAAFEALQLYSGVVGARQRELAPADVRPPDMPESGGPRRPPWRYDESADALEARERTAFDSWLRSVEQKLQQQRGPARAAPLDASYFEQNLETWRQLWRVIERSDVLVLVADIRYPALHFVPALYEHVTRDLSKGMVLALNKCDLVSEHLLTAWKQFFEDEYPGLAIALFSSFPDAKLAPDEQANSELLSKRERRMARSSLAAWGADQLLAAVDTLPLPPHKKAYLEQWRERLDGEHSSVDEVAGRPVSSLGLRLCQPVDDQDADDDGDSARLDGREDDDDEDDGALCKADSGTSTLSPSLLYGSDEEGPGAADDAASRAAEHVLHGHEEDGTLEGMVTIGIIGHPNTGKSTLINGVFGRKVVSTSSTPGHTKHLQTMFLSKHVRLCDCPGLVFPGRVPRELQVIAGMYPISQLREPYSAVKYLAERVPLVSILGLENEIPKLDKEMEECFLGKKGWTAWKICEAWAIKRGFRTAKAARLDVYRAANSILRLALDGRIVLATMPPGYVAPVESDVSAASERGHSTVISTSQAFGTEHGTDRTESKAVRSAESSAHEEGDADSASGNVQEPAAAQAREQSALRGGTACAGGMFDILGEA